MHLLDRGYDPNATHERLDLDRGLVAAISEKGKKPAPLAASSRRWVVERTNSCWHNAHKKLLARCTERRGRRVMDFWVAFSEVVV